MSDSVSPLFSDPVLADQIAHVSEFPPKAARFADPEHAMHAHLKEQLAAEGVSRLYTHQAAAYDAWASGDDYVVTSGTNSGKTLCYSLPALQACLTEPAAKALFLFPTKVLAQDQLSRLRKLNPSPALEIEAYDGDTPKSRRAEIRRSAHIVLSNPDMLHLAILPSHEIWNRYLKSLRLIAIDEMHVYRGVFGSHVASVLRRLLRICEWNRTRPQVVACSATIGNPSELFEGLTGRKPTLIQEDGAPSGKRTFVFWNPPDLGGGRRLSANVTTSSILGFLLEAGQKTMTFSRSRVSAELVLKHARKRAEGLSNVKPSQIESYRAGYTAKERREIEKALFSGKLLGLSATNAMELGVDVGALDAVVMNGYPGTASSFWQQAGRAGRGSRDGIAIMVAHEDPLEQFLVRQPELLLQGQNESIAINPGNPQILVKHLMCAAYERPLAPSELQRFGEGALELAESLDRAGELRFQRGLFYYPKFSSPAAEVDIRGAGGDLVRLCVDGEELGTMERWRAMTQAHEGAVYLHRGSTFMVQELDLEAGTAVVRAATVDYYTQAVVQSVLNPSPPARAIALRDADASVCAVSVTDLVTEYRRRSLDGDTVFEVHPLDLPPLTFDTVAVRLDLPKLTMEDRFAEEMGGIHGLEHALLAVAPLLAGCDRGDLGSAWYPVYPETLRPCIFIFDRTPGGVGLSERLYESVGGWFKAALQLLSSCPCEEGCPSCLLSPRCESSNENLHKQEAVAMLKRLAG